MKNPFNALLPLVSSIASLFGCDGGENVKIDSVSVSRIKVDTSNTLTDVSFSAGGIGYISGWLGTVLKSTHRLVLKGAINVFQAEFQASGFLVAFWMSALGVV